VTRVSDLLADRFASASTNDDDTRPPALSFEFFPPKSVAATNQLLREISTLDRLDPAFISVTYGAGGTTRTRTDSLVCGLSAIKPYPVMPHLTAIGHTTADIKEIIDSYDRAGVRNILALAGDMPQSGPPPVGDFRFASELVDEVKGFGDFAVGVAAFPEVHPRSSSRKIDRVHLSDKLEKADFAITQFFFDVDDYCRLVGELTVLGSSKPIIPGVIPVTNPTTIRRFAEMNGANVPEELFAKLEAADDEDRQKIAIDHASELVSKLLELGVPGLHFYTLNKAAAVTQVVRNCGLR